MPSIYQICSTTMAPFPRNPRELAWLVKTVLEHRLASVFGDDVVRAFHR
jgi:hypothetical protein